MALTKKHYEQIAHVIRTELKLNSFRTVDYTHAERGTVMVVLHRVACDMATDFTRDNPRFDRTRFLTACGF